MLTATEVTEARLTQHDFTKRGLSSNNYMVALYLTKEWGVGHSVVMMNFTATPEHQWQFIQAVVAQAESDDDLGHVAAGPMEHLMGWHGADYIGKVEERAAADPKFARMLDGVWKYKMNDDVWERVQALKARYASTTSPGNDG